MNLAESFLRKSDYIEGESQKPFDIQKLSQMWNEMQDACDKRLDDALTPEEADQAAIEMQKGQESFVRQLIAEKEKFLRVFETEKGSVYFQMQDGQTVRFRRSETGKNVEYSKQIPADQLFFFESDTAKEFMQRRKVRSEIISREFKTVDYEDGMMPIEFFFENNEYYEIEKTSDGFKILAKKEVPDFFEPALPNHVGHKITKIYK